MKHIKIEFDFIPVEERLPSYKESIMALEILHREHRLLIRDRAAYHKGQWYANDGSDDIYKDVTHWANIPNIPFEESELYRVEVLGYIPPSTELRGCTYRFNPGGTQPCLEDVKEIARDFRGIVDYQLYQQRVCKHCEQKYWEKAKAWSSSQSENRYLIICRGEDSMGTKGVEPSSNAF